MKAPMKAKRAPKRDLFAELSEGMTALAQIRLGKHSGTVRGSGNIYRDFDVPDADVRQLKAILAAEIIKTLDKKGLSVRKAQSLTGIDAGDFSRVRNADFRRISVERLMAMINGLG
ncbi:MAG: helix-turn-helix transcriptional regulator, partial [Giesbergeria sp.]